MQSLLKAIMNLNKKIFKRIMKNFKKSNKLIKKMNYELWHNYEKICWTHIDVYLKSIRNWNEINKIFEN